MKRNCRPSMTFQLKCLFLLGVVIVALRMFCEDRPTIQLASTSLQAFRNGAMRTTEASGFDIVIVVPTTLRYERGMLYLNRTLSSLLDELHHSGEFVKRVMVFNKESIPENHETFFLAQKERAEQASVLQFLDPEDNGNLTPFEDPTPDEVSGTKYIAGSWRRKQAVDIANVLVSAKEQFPNSHILLLEDDTKLCPGYLYNLRHITSVVEKLTPLFGVIRTGHGGSGMLLHRDLVKPAAEFVVSKMYQQNVDTSLWMFLEKYPSYYSRSCLAAHIGMVSSFARANVASWVETPCFERMDAIAHFKNCSSDPTFEVISRLGFDSTVCNQDAAFKRRTRIR